MVAARLRRLLLLQRSVPDALRFYRDALGLRVLAGDTALPQDSQISHDAPEQRFAELDAGNGATLALLASPTEAALSTGYSPVLAFDVPDLDATVQAALQAGATLDGPIKHPPGGRAAALRAPDGHMIGLHERPPEDVATRTRGPP